MDMEKETRDLLSEIKEGRILDLKVLEVDGSKYKLEDRKQRAASLFTSRFDQTLEADHCYRVQWINDNVITIVKDLGIKSVSEDSETEDDEIELAEALAEVESEEEEIPF